MADIEKDINEALINDVLQIYADAEDKMLKAVAKRVAKGITTEGWNETKLKDTQALKNEIEKVLNSTSKLSKSKVSKGIIEAYKKGLAEVGGKKGTHNTVLDELDIPMNLKMLVLSTNNLLDNATFQVLRKANDSYQKVMAHATTGLLAGTDTRMQASQKMLNEFASKGITTFVDKAGRNWDLGSYAEMCARTVGSHAALQGHIDRQVEVGEDLVKVSTIGTTCPICQRWQGVVLSISGNHPKYHSVDEAKASGLFHPNCKHTLVMHIPELDGEGKVEPDVYDPNSESSKRNKLIEQQRANERQIRYWKKRQALAITPEEKKKSAEKVKAWQYKQLIYCEKHNLRRQYAREGVRVGNAQGPMGSFIGGSLKEYEEAYTAVIGENPKKVFKGLKLNLQLFAEKKYDKWLKEEIQSLDELDVDKAMMKDANNKNVTPTSLYKKYIGDNPGQDYAAVSEYEKGTKEYKSGYAKWLKTQIDEIGVSYKVKPKYVEVHEDIPDEDKSLSATEFYKKYHNGEKPTDVFKKLGGEEGTGMKYGKWVETQKKEMIKNGITKTVPFSNTSTQKTVNTISEATKVIDDAKKFVEDKVEEKPVVKNSPSPKEEENKVIDPLEEYKKELDNTVHGQYDAYLKVEEVIKTQKKLVIESFNNPGSVSKAELDLNWKKLEMAKEKHLEMVKKKAEKEYSSILSKSFSISLDKLIDMKKHETDPVMKDHIQNQIDIYIKVDAEKKAEEEAKKKAEKEAAAKEAKQSIMSEKVSIGREVRINEGHLVEQDKIYNELDLQDLENLSKQTKGHSLFENDNRRDILGRDRKDGHNHHLGHDVRIKTGLSKEDKELAEAFAIAYNDYFNTAKCQDINLAYLNGYENASPLMRKKIDSINKCIQSNELAEPILLHRFTSPEVMKSIFKTLDFDTIDKDEVFDNDTFISAATGGHPTFGKRNYKMTIQVDKGTHALPSLNHEELEILLGKGKLQFVKTNKYTSTNPQKLKNYDGSYTNFVGEEVVVRYIEDGKASQYEKVTPEKMDNMLGKTSILSHHTQESKDWIDSLEPDEMTAQKRYTGSWYIKMNNVYRKDDRSDKQVTKYSEDLTKALRRAEIAQPVVLRRGIHESDLAHMLGFQGDVSKIKQHWDEINEGGYAAEDKGFLSTSPYKSGGFDKAVELRIYCPTGTHAAYVDSISTNKGEKETLLQSGSIYKVHKLVKEGRHTIAYVELLGTD